MGFNLMDNVLISRAFSLYAELLQLHGQGERLSDWLAGAAYRIRQLEVPVTGLSAAELVVQFRPEVVEVILEAKQRHTIEALDERVHLTPAGLFDMMRIKGLGGRKLHVLWETAKIDTIERLLAAAKAGDLHGIPGFGKKTELNIISTIEAMNSSAELFHYASLADVAEQFVADLRRRFKTELVSLCGDIRRQATTVERIEVLAAIELGGGLEKLMTISEQTGSEVSGHTHEMIVPKVIVEDYEGARAAVQHWIDRGRKRIAHLSGPESLSICRKRKAGYIDTLKKTMR